MGKVIVWLIVILAIVIGGAGLQAYVRFNDRTGLYVALGCLGFAALYLIVGGLVARKRHYRLRAGVVVRLVAGMLIVMAVAGSVLYTTIHFGPGCASRIGPGAVLENCNLGRKDLSGRDLYGADLERAVLRNATLRQANLADAVLTEANLAGADLADATLDGAVLDHANLAGANLTGATLDGAVLDHADLAGANLTGVTLDGVVLDGVNLQDATGLSDEALARALGVSTGELAGVLSQKGMRLESREAILTALQAVCQGRGVAGAAPYAGDATFHPLVLLDAQGKAHAQTDAVLKENLEPMALRFAELVLCMGAEREVAVQTCSYRDGSPITRYQYPVHVWLVAAETGATVAEHDFEEKASRCPYMAPKNQTRIEAHVQFEDMLEWLGGFVNPPATTAAPRPALTQPAPTPKPTGTPVITPVSRSCPPNATYLQDVSVPDGTEFAPGESFTKVWRIRSTGCAPWPADTRLVFDSGDRMEAPAGVDVPETPLGSAADVSVTMIAPDTPGTYKSYWQMEAPDGTRYGDRFYLLIVVR